MGKVSLMIDGRKVTVEEGMTILEAAKSIGIEIPHLCYMEGLPPTGACRPVSYTHLTLPTTPYV